MRLGLLASACFMILAIAGSARAQSAGSNVAAAAMAAQAFPNGIQTQADLMKYEMLRRALSGHHSGVKTGNPNLAMPQGYGVPTFGPNLPAGGQPRGISRGSGHRNAPVNAQDAAEKKKADKKAAVEARKAELEAKKAAKK